MIRSQPLRSFRHRFNNAVQLTCPLRAWVEPHRRRGRRRDIRRTELSARRGLSATFRAKGGGQPRTHNLLRICHLCQVAELSATFLHARGSVHLHHSFTQNWAAPIRTG
jgi:hypothetical protein